MQALAFLCLLPVVLGDIPTWRNMQILGTHNSYKKLVRPREEYMPYYRYELPPLNEQFQAGVLFFEFDIQRRPDNSVAVAHVIVNNIDPGTHCATLDECFVPIKEWIQATPGHPTLFIYVNVKAQSLTAGEVDAVVKAAWGPTGSVYTPGSFQRGRNSLAEAVETAGWPHLVETMGKVVFLTDFDPEFYAQGIPDTHMLFPTLSYDRIIESEPEVNLDSLIFTSVGLAGTPRALPEEILAQAVDSGKYIVRVSVDSDYPNDEVDYNQQLLAELWQQFIDTDESGGSSLEEWQVVIAELSPTTLPLLPTLWGVLCAAHLNDAQELDIAGTIACNQVVASVAQPVLAPVPTLGAVELARQAAFGNAHIISTYYPTFVDGRPYNIDTSPLPRCNPRTSDGSCRFPTTTTPPKKKRNFRLNVNNFITYCSGSSCEEL